MKKSLILTISIALAVQVAAAGRPLKLIPYPNKVEMKGGWCDLSRGVVTAEQGELAGFLYEYMNELGIGRNADGVGVSFYVSEEVTNPEGYILDIDPAGITVTASEYAGHFYALQTLRQMVCDGKAPAVRITDAPVLAWRAFMIDEARHFLGMETIKRMMDDAALLKLNTFHWHLTDDTGWRIEIKKYPLLTEIGSRRDSTQIADPYLDIPGETGDPAYDEFLRRYQSDISDSNPHQGFYTQDEIRQIIAYAASRCIKIVPEVSMPGHASAAIASYPWLGTTKEPMAVPCRFGVLSSVYDPSSPETIAFLQDVMREVGELFPSDYIHIGGDEVKYGQWEQSPAVREYMRQHGLENCRDLQVKMTNDMCAFIEYRLGKTIVGWNEILGINAHIWGTEVPDASEKLSHKAVVQFWAGNKDILKYALDNGYRVVNSYSEDTYINYSYDQVPLERSYRFDPVPEGYSREQIYGLGCQLWTEWIRNRDDLEYHAFPRNAAYAETGWTDSSLKNYEEFRLALRPLIQRWVKAGYNIPEMFK